MPSTCPHGYPADSCLICQTLAAGRPAGRIETTAPASTQQGSTRDGPRRGSGRIERVIRPERPPGAPGRQDAVAPARDRRHLGLTPSVLLIVLAVIAVLGVVWAVAGLVFAILRLIELLAAVAVAGWVGYRVGLTRGRRER